MRQLLQLTWHSKSVPTARSVGAGYRRGKVFFPAQADVLFCSRGQWEKQPLEAEATLGKIKSIPRERNKLLAVISLLSSLFDLLALTICVGEPTLICALNSYY